MYHAAADSIRATPAPLPEPTWPAVSTAPVTVAARHAVIARVGRAPNSTQSAMTTNTGNTKKITVARLTSMRCTP